MHNKTGELLGVTFMSSPMRPKVAGRFPPVYCLIRDNPCNCPDGGGKPTLADDHSRDTCLTWIMIYILDVFGEKGKN